MAKFELNIYGKDDEIINTYKTDHIRWGLLTAALALQDEIKDSSQDEQFKAISEFAKEIFFELTDADLQNADAFDVINNFKQITNMAKKLNGSKN